MPLLAGAACSAAAAGPIDAIAAAAAPDARGGDDSRSQRIAEMRAELDGLNRAVDEHAGDLALVRAIRGERTLSQERAEDLRRFVIDSLAGAERGAALFEAGAISGYDGGFFVSSPDGNFRLVVNAQMQMRYALSRLSTRSLGQLDAGTNQPPASGPLGTPPGGTELRGFQGFVGTAPQRTARTARGFEVRDMKLTFSGHVVDPSWQYQLTINEGRTSSQTAFTTVSTSADAFGASSTGPLAGNASAGPGTAGGRVEIEYALVTKRLDEHWSITVGQFKPPLLKEELVASWAQLLVQRSLANQFFSAKFTQGIELEFQNDALRVIGSFNDGGNNNNGSAIIGNDTSLGSFSDGALTARAEWKIAGTWGQFDDLSSVPGEPFGMYVGGAVNWQRGGHRLGAATNDTWSVASGANGNLVASGSTLFGSGVPILVPATSIQYPNNLPINGNSAASNLTWTVDGMIHVEGFSLFGAVTGNIASGIPAGWISNPSGGFTPLDGAGNGPNAVPNNVSLVPGNGSDGGIVAFVPGYGGGNEPIFSYGVIVLAGWFISDEIQLYGGWEWYATRNNGSNAYAGNTASFWGWLPGGSSPFANNSSTNNAGGVPDGANTPNDGYVGGGTNPYADRNFGANPFAAQHNSVITLGAAWYPNSFRQRQVKVMGEVSYAFAPVLFQQGIFGQAVNADDWRNDGGQPGGGQVVVRLQVQLFY
ncbi:MAG: hypothetical protein FJ253_00930 [Phycisphaerae bacterium]|nr:hypothetical protein [Phycisphaerae bacterium]